MQRDAGNVQQASAPSIRGPRRFQNVSGVLEDAATGHARNGAMVAARTRRLTAPGRVNHLTLAQVQRLLRQATITPFVAAAAAATIVYS